MRKKAMLLAVFLLALALLFTGCKRSNVAYNFGQGLEEWRPDKQKDDSLRGKSDIVEYDTPEFGPTLGFGMTSWPDGDGLEMYACFAIDEFGQVQYRTPEDWVLVLRVAPEGTTLASLYQETHYHNREEYEAGGVKVTQGSALEDGCAIALWNKDGFTYTLHSNKKQGRMPEEVVTRIADEVNTAYVEGGGSPEAPASQAS